MFEIFNTVDGVYTLPDGTTLTSQQLKETGEYDILFQKVCVAEVVDGVFRTYVPLANMAYTYGIEYTSDSEDDPKEVLDKVLEKKKFAEEHPPVTVSDTVLRAAQFVALSFTDEQALEVRDLYPVFEIGHAYKKDERFTYNGHLFKVNQNHTSQEQWVPGETGTESLYTSLEMGENGYLNWKQPTGSHDAYNTGDIVNYKGELYKSLIDGNAWAPDAYPAGWEKYTEPTS